MKTEISLIQAEFRGATRKDSRTIWIQPPILQSRPTGVCLFLDGEYHLLQIRAAATVVKLQQTQQFRPMLTAYVSHGDDTKRWEDSCCNLEFARYIVTELLPWMVDEFGASGGTPNIIAGVSLTGLAAAHIAMNYPTAFPRVLSQSGSFWWNENWLPQNVKAVSDSRISFRLTVGSGEITENVEHSDHGQKLFQRESQLVANRRMRDALLAAGHQVSYHEHPGVHDFAPWRGALAESLSLLASL